MVTKSEIPNEGEGWKKVADMIHASYTCHNAKQVVKTIESLKKSKKIEILRIVPKLDQELTKEVVLNFDF